MRAKKTFSTQDILNRSSRFSCMVVHGFWFGRKRYFCVSWHKSVVGPIGLSTLFLYFHSSSCCFNFDFNKTAKRFLNLISNNNYANQLLNWICHLFRCNRIYSFRKINLYHKNYLDRKRTERKIGRLMHIWREIQLGQNTKVKTSLRLTYEHELPIVY